MQAEERRGPHALDSEARLAQGSSDADRRMVEMQRLVLDRTERERRRALAAQQAPRDGLEVALVGVFENENATRPGDAAQLGQHGPGVGEVVKHSNAHRGVEVAVGVGQGAGIAEDDVKEMVAGQSFAGRRHVDLGRVEQDDLVVAAILVREPAESGPDFDQAIASSREQRSDGKPIAGVLVPAGGPEDVAVAEVLVRREGSFRRRRPEAAGRCQEGLAAPTARLWMANSSAMPDQPQSHRTTFVRAL